MGGEGKGWEIENVEEEGGKTRNLDEDERQKGNEGESEEKLMEGDVTATKAGDIKENEDTNTQPQE